MTATCERACVCRGCGNRFTGRSNKLTCSHACRMAWQRDRQVLLSVAEARLRNLGETQARQAWSDDPVFAAWLSEAAEAYMRTRPVIKLEAVASVDPDSRLMCDGTEADPVDQVTPQWFIMERAPDVDRVFKDRDIAELEAIAAERPLTPEDWSSAITKVLREIKPQLVMGFKPDKRWFKR